MVFFSWQFFFVFFSTEKCGEMCNFTMFHYFLEKLCQFLDITKKKLGEGKSFLKGINLFSL
jgi:hypothetical protein